MKNKQHEHSRSKRMLDKMKKAGKKEVIWALRPDQVTFLSRFFQITPYLYTMKTKQFSNVRNLESNLLKDLHFARKSGKDFMTRRLKNEDLKILKKNGVSFRILKYKIVLNSSY